MVMEYQENFTPPDTIIATRPSTPTTRNNRNKSQLSNENITSRLGKKMKLDYDYNKKRNQKVKQTKIKKEHVSINLSYINNLWNQKKNNFGIWHNYKVQQRMSSPNIYLLQNKTSENSMSTSSKPNNQLNKSSKMVDTLPQHFNSYPSYIQTSTYSNISSITKDKQYRETHEKNQQFLDN